MNNKPVLATENLTASIAGKTICQNLDLAVNAGECWAILGQNGTGKTTLLHTLAGMRTIDSGQVNLNGTSLLQLNAKTIAQQCGLLLQDSQDIFPATVMEAVLIGRHPHLSAWQWESEEDKAIALSALNAVGLTGLAQRDIHTLSGGERRRVAIATVLAQQPGIYLLDEPVNHLDISHQHQVLKLFADIARNEHKTVMMVLHDINLAARYCDHALLIYDDKIESGTKEDMLNEEKLSALYGHPIRMIENEKMLFMPS